MQTTMQLYTQEFSLNFQQKILWETIYLLMIWEDIKRQDNTLVAVSIIIMEHQIM